MKKYITASNDKHLYGNCLGFCDTSIKWLLFPASGYRNNNTGTVNNQGTNGYFWASAPSTATNGFNLNFNSTNVNPRNSNNRAYGYGVRCSFVQEFATA